jgi:hypothetical protein
MIQQLGLNCAAGIVFISAHDIERIAEPMRRRITRVHAWPLHTMTRAIATRQTVHRPELKKPTAALFKI